MDNITETQRSRDKERVIFEGRKADIKRFLEDPGVGSFLGQVKPTHVYLTCLLEQELE